MKSLLVGPVTVAAIALAACASAPDDDTGASSESPLISDASSLIQRPDGRFDVVCKDGSREVVTAEQIAANEVCNSTPFTCVRRCAARFQNGNCREWAADYCDRGATCRPHVIDRFQNGNPREYGPDFCTSGPSMCVAQCTERFQNGNPQTFGPDRCAKGTIACIPRVVARFQNGNPQAFGPDFCKEGNPPPRCNANCIRRFPNGNCSEYGADICM